MEGLIALGEPVVTPLLNQLDGYNYGARAWAVRALSGIGDPRGLDVLLEAAVSDFALSVRRAAARGLGAIHWEKLPTAAIESAQDQAVQVLLVATADPEWVVRYAAVVGLQGLGMAVITQPPDWCAKVSDRLKALIKTDETLAVQARAKLAQQSLDSHL